MPPFVSELCYCRKKQLDNFFEEPSIPFQTGEFLFFYENMPEHVIPKYRAQRSYISSILSKNELFREDKYNKKLFMRLKQGEYVLNPQIEIQVEDEWVNVYELLQMDELRKLYGNKSTYFFNIFYFFKESNFE